MVLSRRSRRGGVEWAGGGGHPIPHNGIRWRFSVAKCDAGRTHKHTVGWQQSPPPSSCMCSSQYQSRYRLAASATWPSFEGFLPSQRDGSLASWLCCGAATGCAVSQYCTECYAVLGGCNRALLMYTLSIDRSRPCLFQSWNRVCLS